MGAGTVIHRRAGVRGGRRLCKCGSGTLLGATAGNFAGGDFLWLPFRDIAANRVPCLLLALWLAYRLYPYVPTIDLHKYWNALKQVVFPPRPTGYDLFRYTAIWLTVGSLIEPLAAGGAGGWLFPTFHRRCAAGKVVIIGKTLSAAEIDGAAIALAVWLPARHRRQCADPDHRYRPAVLGLHRSPSGWSRSSSAPTAGRSAGHHSAAFSTARSRSTYRPFSKRPFSTAP